MVHVRYLSLVQVYFHECFLRGQLFLVGRISQNRNPRRLTPSQEPNFYVMPRLDAEAAGSTPAANRGQATETIPVNPTPGQSTLPPAAVGFPVLARLIAPSARVDDTGIHSNSTLIDRNASEVQAHAFLRERASRGEDDSRKDEDQDRGLGESKDQD
jgi:hypothetical protein